MNEILFVQVHNIHNPPTFSVQFAPYNSTEKPAQCSINIANLTDHYVYSIAVNETYSEFFFIGELINDQHGTFVGVIKINHDQSNLCNCNFTYSLEYFYEYEHQEYYILGVEPKGHYAYGFSNEFVFLFDSSKNTSNLECWNGDLIWPMNSFMPHAVHLRNDFGIIAGFIQNVLNTRVKYISIIYLINFNSTNHHPIIVDQQIPVTTPHTWEDLFTNADANIYSPKYDMSVSINDRGYVLVGMQYINRVSFLSVNLLNPTKLTYISSFTNGRSLGYGKSVVWLDNGNMAAILANTHSFDYDWETSQISIYDMKSGVYNSNSKPLSIFPNYHQRVPKIFNSIFLNIISSSISLALLDNDGNVLIFVPTSPGFFPSIPTTGSMPLITSQQSCLPGTYKNQTGIHDCILCPKYTKNPGHLHTQCVTCSPSSFCPLGSSSETNLSSLHEVISSFPYPRSSDMTGFDGVLLDHIFGIKPNHCHVSPALFITLIVGSILLVFIVPLMFILKHLIKNSTTKKTRKQMKCILKSLDMIDQGNYWLGGLLSIPLITLIVCTCIFANKFINAYPIENASVSYLSCDTFLLNALFESSVKSLGIPQIPEEQKMIDLLDGQNFTLNVQFVNTIINCDAIAAIQGLFGTTWLTVHGSDCMNVNSTLSIFIPLPHQLISIKVLLDDVQTIGGLRIGMYGDEYISENYRLKKLHFYKSYYKNGYILGKNVPISLILTKVINETVSMDDGPSNFSGMLIPSCKFDLNNILLSSEQYILSTLSTISLQISIAESSYYEKNLQQPMARKSQVIFYSILWIFVCFDLFGLLFLLYKLGIKPIFKYLKEKISFCRGQEQDQNQQV